MSNMKNWKNIVQSANLKESDSEDANYTDHEVSMAKSQLLSSVKSSTRIAKHLSDKSEDEGIPGWVASKLTVAEDYLQAVADYMDGEELQEGYKVMPPMDPKYVARKGLEGPFTTLSGKVVYYDPKEGKYYDPDTDIYLSYDEFQNYDKDYSGMKEEAGRLSDSADTTKYGIIRYPDTAISYIKNDGNGWEHIYDKSYGFEGPVDKEDLKYAKKIAKEKMPSRLHEATDTCECGCECGKDVCESCGKKHSVNESQQMMTEAQFDEAAGEKDACYRKVKSRYKVWPSAYASGALVKCRKVGAKNWGNSKNESINEDIDLFPVYPNIKNGINAAYGTIDDFDSVNARLRKTIADEYGDDIPDEYQKPLDFIVDVIYKKLPSALRHIEDIAKGDEVYENINEDLRALVKCRKVGAKNWGNSKK
jgi:hypothetical protein